MATSGCGCGGSPASSAESSEPIVCTLAGADQAQRANDFRAAFSRLVTTEPFDGGFRWTFRGAPGLEQQLRELAQREHECCRFFRFDVFAKDAVVIWETRARPDATAVMNEFMRLPETLRADLDAQGLQGVLRSAGLTFISDEEPGR